MHDHTKGFHFILSMPKMMTKIGSKKINWQSQKQGLALYHKHGSITNIIILYCLATLMGFQFGLSAAIKRAKEKTDKKKRVYFDQKQICNLGQVRYLTDRHGIHKISKSFYRSVRNLPIIYNEDKYMKFIEDWGTVSSHSVAIRVEKFVCMPINNFLILYSILFSKLMSGQRI